MKLSGVFNLRYSNIICVRFKIKFVIALTENYDVTNKSTKCLIFELTFL